MLNRGRELFWSLIAILLITLLYTGVVFRLGSVPAAQSFFGHSLGVLGFTLMLLTETLYSLRKRIRSARWGKMAAWLQFHIFTGLVGPYLVFLHTAWKFNGLAGVVFLLTVIIVISGFIGRYIYTAVPRTADGVEIQAREIGENIRRIEAAIAEWKAQQSTVTPVFARELATNPANQDTGPALVLNRAFVELTLRWNVWREQRKLSAPLRAQMADLERMLQQRRTLHRQMASLAYARRLLAVWHAVHIPIGMALFISAFVHIAAAIYYATLLH